MATTGPPLNLPILPPDGARIPSDKFNEAMYILGGGAGAPAWVAWVPTWVNFTPGNGTVVAKYMQVGKIVVAHLVVTLGSTSAVSGDLTFSLPLTRTTGFLMGRNAASDVSAGVLYEGTVLGGTTTNAVIRFLNAAGTYLTIVAASATIPFTWATTDAILAMIIYEAA